MKLFVESEEIPVTELAVFASIGDITRSFYITLVEEEQSIFIGDKVEVEKNNGDPLISGVVERVRMVSEGEWLYAGRGKTKVFADSYVKKTTHFTDKKTLKDFLSSLAEESGIEISGDFEVSSELRRCVYEGESVISILKWMTSEFGSMLIANAEGNLDVFNKPGEPESVVLTRDSNITSSTLDYGTRFEYDKYTVISQDEEELEIKGSVGSGKKEIILTPRAPMTEADCKKRAELAKIRSNINTFTYKADIDEEVEINKVYQVEDVIAGISEPLLCTKIKYIFSTSSISDADTISVVSAEFTRI